MAGEVEKKNWDWLWTQGICHQEEEAISKWNDGRIPPDSIEFDVSLKMIKCHSERRMGVERSSWLYLSRTISRGWQFPWRLAWLHAGPEERHLGRRNALSRPDEHLPSSTVFKPGSIIVFNSGKNVSSFFCRVHNVVDTFNFYLKY